MWHAPKTPRNQVASLYLKKHETMTFLLRLVIFIALSSIISCASGLTRKDVERHIQAEEYSKIQESIESGKLRVEDITYASYDVNQAIETYKACKEMAKGFKNYNNARLQADLIVIAITKLETNCSELINLPPDKFGHLIEQADAQSGNFFAIYRRLQKMKAEAEETSARVRKVLDSEAEEAAQLAAKEEDKKNREKQDAHDTFMKGLMKCNSFYFI